MENKLFKQTVKFMTVALTFIYILSQGQKSISASEEKVVITDMAGRDVKTDGKGDILASSDIVFEFKDILKPEDTESGNEALRDWIFCEAEEEGDKNILSPVKNKRFKLNLNGDREIKFVWLDRESGEIREEPALKRSYKIHYSEDPDTEPEIRFEYENGVEDGELYLSGEEPKLTVKGKEGAHTFVLIISGDEESLYEINDEKGFTFKEGEYEIKVWGEDGWGVKTYADMEADSFIYDHSAPSLPEIKIGPSGHAYMKGDTLCTAEPVVISPDSCDELSGVDRYIFHIKNDLDKGEYEAECDEIQLNPMFSGAVTVKAADRAGNISGEAGSGKILIDSERPFLTGYSVKEDKDKRICAEFNAEDTHSGLRKMEVFLNKGSVFKQDYEGKEKGAAEVLIDIKDLDNGKNIIRLECEDMVSNRVFYEFMLDKNDERKEDRDKRDEEDDDPEDEEDEEPELYLKGFKNFDISEGPIEIEAGTYGLYDGEGRVLIERHDESGETTDVYEAEEGYIRINEEGSYVVKYIVPGKDREYERTGYFTIDRSAPKITSLKNIDKKSFSAFAMNFDLLNDISDQTYVNANVTLSGREYNGERITDPGKYVLKLSATDQLGHSAAETAEFIIINKSREKADKKAEDTDTETVSGNMESKKNESVSRNKSISKNDIRITERRLSENKAGEKEIKKEKTLHSEKSIRTVLVVMSAVMVLFTVIIAFLELFLHPDRG